MGYIHVEIETSQSPKKPGAACGDVVRSERSPAGTTLICADGLGSGIKANLAATMAASRLLELLRGGVSLRRAFGILVRTMESVKGTDLPYAVLSVVRILPDGQGTVLSYEMPPPFLLSHYQAMPLPQRLHPLPGAMVGESTCHLEPGEGVLVVSDGITQAGLGLSLRSGWGSEGLGQYLQELIGNRTPLAEIPAAVHSRAQELWEGVHGDDCTATLARCRWGRSLTLLTGPPAARGRDHEVAVKLLQQEGAKVVAGATTAEIVARALGHPLEVEQDARSRLAPPRYYLEGLDLVCEGAVTLNQAYNIIDTPPATWEEDSGVTQLAELLQSADRVHFMVGLAQNPAHEDLAFRQRGLLSREKIVPLLADKLREAGKLVTQEYL